MRRLGTLDPDGICFDYALPLTGGDCEYHYAPATAEDDDIDVEAD